MTPPRPLAVSYAEIDWDDHDTPVSRRFGDVYFSRENGRAASEHVFLKSSRLAERWSSRPAFAVGEIGFGSALNFLLTWNEWRRSRNGCGMLHYVAFDAEPMRAEDIRRALSPWRDLTETAEALLDHYQPLVPGFQRLSFPAENLRLTLGIGDAGILLEDFAGAIDAWYLDGFAPSRNPDMWSANLLRLVAARSAPGATAAAFSAADSVCAALAQAGFRAEKSPGFGPKRESVRAVLDARAHTSDPEMKPWHGPAESRNGAPGHAAIIGSGLAGSAAAHALAARGWTATIIDRAPGAAAGASGNDAGIVLPYIAAQPNARTALYLPAYLYAVRELDQLLACGYSIGWRRSGAVHLAATDRLERLVASIADLGLDPLIGAVIDAETASAYAGVPVAESALYYALAGSVHPAALVRAHIAAGGGSVSSMHGADVRALRRAGDRWELFDATGALITSADIVIGASAFERAYAPEVSWIPLEPIRGEVVSIELPRALAPLALPLSFGTYLVPLGSGAALLGATYDHGDSRTEPSAEKHAWLLERLGTAFPTPDPARITGSRVSFRASTHHRLPYVGAVPERGYPNAEYVPGLYVSMGHGSRGLLSTTFAAEILADTICGSPLPVGRTLANMMNPASFLARGSETKLS